MKGKDILVFQLAGSFNVIAEHLHSENAARYWDKPAFDGSNPPGFTLWHCARTIDWGVQCAIRGIDEVARRSEWSARIPAQFRFGAGLSPEAARDAAARFSPDTVSEYLTGVKAESLGWLAEQSDETLDAVPDFREHNERVEGYTDPAVWADIKGLEGIPAWQILARPCIAHIRVHMGEVDAILQSLAGSRQN